MIQALTNVVNRVSQTVRPVPQSLTHPLIHSLTQPLRHLSIQLFIETSHSY